MNKKIDWAKAATNGLFLSITPIAADYIHQIFQIEGTLGLLINLLKVAGCTAVLHYFIKKNFIENNSELTYGSSFKYGMAVSLFSTVVCTLATVLLYQVIIPGYFEEMVTQLLISYEQMGVEGLVDYDMLMSTMPMTITIGQIFNCLLWGLILSSILANTAKIKKDNPFQ
jgi:hypothetical protein